MATSFRPASSQSLATKASLETAVQMWVNDRATALSTYGPISGWVVSSITDMRYLFNGLATFDEDVSSWNTSSVTDMHYMFNVRTPARVPCPQCPVGSSVHAACIATLPPRGFAPPTARVALRVPWCDSAGRVEIQPAAQLHDVQRHGHEQHV